MWQINPGIAVHLTERFKLGSIRYEVGKLVRSSTNAVLDISEALPLLLGERLDPHIHRDLKVHLVYPNLASLTATIASPTLGACPAHPC